MLRRNRIFTCERSEGPEPRTSFAPKVPQNEGYYVWTQSNYPLITGMHRCSRQRRKGERVFLPRSRQVLKLLAQGSICRYRFRRADQNKYFSTNGDRSRIFQEFY